VSENTDQLSQQLADYVTQISKDAIASRGAFHVAISGGSLPVILAKKLREPPYTTEVDWSKWVVWFADERYVSLDDDNSNYKETKKALLQYVGVLDSNVHVIDASLPLPECAKQYQKQLADVFGGGSVPQLDLVLLGMGPDGHTASLFPNHPLLKETEVWIAPISDSPKPPPERVTFTFPLIDNSKEVAFVASGESKKEMLARIIDESTVPWGELPCKLVNPHSGNLHWFVDAPAAQLLKKSSL